MFPARCLRWIDTTGFSPISRHHWYKKNFAPIRGVHFFERWAILVLISKSYYFYTYICANHYKRKTSGSLTLEKEKRERNFIEFLQFEMFQNEILTSKIYHTNFILSPLQKVFDEEFTRVLLGKRIFIHIKYFFYSTTCLEKMKKNNCQKKSHWFFCTRNRISY